MRFDFKRRISLQRFLMLPLLIFCLSLFIAVFLIPDCLPAFTKPHEAPIKWVEFNVPYPALEKAMLLDIASYESEIHLNWIELLSYLATKYGGDFNRYESKDLDLLAAKLKAGEYPAHLAKAYNSSLYDYYLKSYTAVLGGMLGTYKVAPKWQNTYGLKAFSPIASGYYYQDYDDFGSGRSYGYTRKHMGHDFLVSTGTPVISVESGIVEALGWNQYGGWRIGIRSLDGLRYHYYAHLQKGKPYAANLYIGKAITAGDVIGYSGQTGYSIKENVNNIDTPHLHYGMQLIFDEEKKDSPTQIWVDLYSITRLLSAHRADLVKSSEGKEFTRKYKFSEDATETAYFMSDKKQTLAVLTSAGKISPPEDTLTLPILMYHGLLKDPAMQNKFVISPRTFAADLQYLKAHDYTPIFMTDLIDYVHHKRKTLPQKPIILTFDDGYYNNYLYAYPLLKSYEMKAVISIIGRFSDEFSEQGSDHATYSHVTWPQINEMMASGLIEIQNHTYDMHTYDQGRKGTMQKTSESTEEYRKVMDLDVGYLQQHIKELTGFTPNTFTYPFGYMSDGSTKILKDMGFSSTLSCHEGINFISSKNRNPQELYLLKRILRPPYEDSSVFFQKHGIL